MSYILEPKYVPETVEYDNKEIKFRNMYHEVKRGINNHLDNRINYWTNMENKYNVGEPGIEVSVKQDNKEDSSEEDSSEEDETENQTWPKYMWALYLTAVKFYKRPSEMKDLESLDVELEKDELGDFSEIYEQIMDSDFTAQELDDNMGY